MARKSYTQTVEPISRIAERIFGWIAWAALLAVTGLILFFSLVTVNDQAMVDEITALSQQQAQELGVSPEALADQMLTLMNSMWMVALYLAVPLLLGLFGLITMRRRILAGFLLLIAGIMTAPLVFGIVTGLIPLFFVIAAILLFVRKDRIVMHDDGGGPLDERPRDERYARGDLDRPQQDRGFDNDRVNRSTAAGAGYAGGRSSEDELDDTLVREDVRRRDSRADQDNRNRDYSNDDMEQTRQFRSLGDEPAGRDSNDDSRAGLVSYDDERLERGSDKYVDNNTVSSESDRFVDGNIDSQEPVEPVTEDEYRRSGGTPGFSDDVSEDDGVTLSDTDEKRRKGSRDEYDYNASRERRDNVNRRNNDRF